MCNFRSAVAAALFPESPALRFTSGKHIGLPLRVRSYRGYNTKITTRHKNLLSRMSFYR